VNVPTRRWSNRAIAREVDVHRTRRIWAAFAGIVLAAMPFAVYLLIQNECVKLTYEFNDLRASHDLLIERQRRLEVRRATLSTLDRVEEWALAENGMARPDPNRVVVVRRGEPSPGDLLARGHTPAR
jgi:cell division protein FtsL